MNRRIEVEPAAGRGWPTVEVGAEPVALAAIEAVARGQAAVVLSAASEFDRRLQASREALEAAVARGVPVYGVTTGYGESCGNRVGAERSRELGANLIRYHGCGAGEPLGAREARAGTFCRLVGLARGYSGVSRELLQAMADLLNAGLAPVIPALGSVGASGDLTPLSYLAACLAGEREAWLDGRRLPAAEALRAAGLSPYRFAPKEPLALINGTSIMTGIAAVVCGRARRLLRAATIASALAVHALSGHAHHFDARLFAAKPHPGQAGVAAELRRLLTAAGGTPESRDPDWLQDPYSVRCTPHVLGVLADGLEWVERWVVVEANSANDNPLVDPDSGAVLMGGNFYGGHIAFAMDALKSALASAADLIDRQLALLVDERFNRGLPADLVRAAEADLHHGFKGMQITASALTAEALKLGMPAAAFSRSTESHNQDKVSLGTIAARDADRVCTLAGGAVAVGLLAAVQAAEIRGRLADRPALARAVAAVRDISPAVDADRPLDGDLQRITDAILAGRLFAPDDGDDGTAAHGSEA